MPDLPDRLASQLADRLRRQALPAGARLPSVRRCAEQEGVSPSTVVQAYDRLQAEGLIESRPKRGFFVRAAGRGAPAARGDEGGPRAAREGGLRPTAVLAPPVDATALIRGMFARVPHPAPADGAAGEAAGTGRVRPRLVGPGPGQGTLPPQWLDADLLARALRQVLRRAEQGLHYGEPAGDLGLRQALSRHLGSACGIHLSPAQIVTTLGATHGLDLVARTLLVPGDAVLVDQPGWAVEFAGLTRLGMRLLPVPRAAEGGPDLDALAALAEAHAPKVYVTMSVLHNPTGHSLAPAVAHRLLNLAAHHGFTLVEDDIYGWFAPPHLPRLAALDGLQRTVYVGGFSKVLAPDWRVGFVAASPQLIDKLIDTKLLAALTTPSLTESAVAWCLEQGLLRRHAQRLIERLDAARARVVKLAEQAGCRFVVPPQGLFGWVDAGVDTDRLAAQMARQGWLLAPGSLFHTTPRPGTLMRLNFATAGEARFWQAFARVRRTLG